MALIKGIPIEMGGAEWIVPPLTIGQVRALRAEREAVARDGADTEEIMGAAGAIILAALQRNYPDVTRNYVEDVLLDLGNFREVLVATLTGSGLRPAVSGEAAAARTGSASMGSSPLPVATDPETLTS